MDAEITVEYTKALVRRATRRFWIRYMRWSRFFLLFFLIATFLVMLYMGYRDWRIFFVGGLAGFLLAVIVVGYFVYYRRTLADFDLREDPRCTFRFSDDGMSAQSELGSSEAKWKAIRKIWRFPEVWLLFFGSRAYMTLPTEPLSPELKDFIARKVEESGGKVS